MFGTEKSLVFRDLLRTGLGWNPLRNACIKMALRHCQHVLCVSDALRTALQRHGIKNLITFRNGIDTDFWKPMPQGEARQSLQLPLDRPIVLLAGRVGIDKGSALVDALLPKNTLLLLAGEACVEDFVHCSDRLQYYPKQSPEQMRLLYAAADLALVPSICLDCLPTICLEAGACARPVIASTYGGAKEIVTNGTTGWVLNPHDRDTFRSRMEWCSEHRMELLSFGTAARKHIEENFSLKQYIMRLEAIYASVARRRL
jgi:glycosyltransferase involved in cell wall biosynthesis